MYRARRIFWARNTDCLDILIINLSGGDSERTEKGKTLRGVEGLRAGCQVLGREPWRQAWRGGVIPPS